MRLALLVICVLGCGRRGFEDLPDATRDAAPDPGVVELSSRGTAACVRSGDGRVACWGSNERGQLGRGTVGTIEGPALVPLANVVRIATGENIAFAIDRDGTLWGWGANANGELGLGMTGADRPSPQRVLVPPVSDVAGGEYHACAITTQGGELYCWGDNACGQLGSGDTNPNPTPTRVAGVSGAVRVTVSDQQTCVTDASGNTRCMGASYFMAGCQNQQLTPTPPTGIGRVVDVAGGCHMSTCAVDTNGAAWCWGDNLSGVLGDGGNTPRANPSRVAVITNAAKIGTGFATSCAATVTDDVFCWGTNAAGELGVSSTMIGQSSTPLQVPFFGGMPVDEIETGCASTCVLSGHDVYCWGKNDKAVIDDTGVDAFAPTLRTALPF